MCDFSQRDKKSRYRLCHACHCNSRAPDVAVYELRKSVTEEQIARTTCDILASRSIGWPAITRNECSRSYEIHEKSVESTTPVSRTDRISPRDYGKTRGRAANLLTGVAHGRRRTSKKRRAATMTIFYHALERYMVSGISFAIFFESPEKSAGFAGAAGSSARMSGQISLDLDRAAS